MKVRSSTVQGRNGGLPFDDYHPTRQVVTEIRVRATQYIVAIQVVYEGYGTAPQHGGGGGDTSHFCLDEGEKIVRIDGRAAALIDQLQFFTSKGDFFRKFYCFRNLDWPALLFYVGRK